MMLHKREREIDSTCVGGNSVCTSLVPNLSSVSLCVTVSECHIPCTHSPKKKRRVT